MKAYFYIKLINGKDEFVVNAYDTLIEAKRDFNNLKMFINDNTKIILRQGVDYVNRNK